MKRATDRLFERGGFRKLLRGFAPTRRVLIRRVAIVGGGLLLLGAMSAAALVVYLSHNLPSVEQIDSRQVRQSTKIYDRRGEVLLYEISGGEKRTVVPWEDIPSSLRQAAIAMEDETFYTEERAFEWKAILRAAFVNLRSGRVRQGGSTITQQLARNAFLSPEQTITRKIRELILAVEINQRYTKDQILHLYLNEIPFGPTIYGAAAASQAYFGKSVKDLTLPESALLVALLKAPSYYSPWGSHVPELLAREQLVLAKMHSLGMVSDAEFETARNTRLVFEPQTRGIRAPHFVIMAQDYLVRKYGEDIVREGGLTVTTTLDSELQDVAERVVREGAARNEALYGGTNAALVAEDPRTGQVLALVGSRDYFDTAHDGNFNVAAQGLRQPGSALKPFVYLTAFRKGYRPETVLFDVPTEFAAQEPACPAIPDFTRDMLKCFHPQNFDERFRGPLPLRIALAQSVNIPAVKTLYLAGLPDVLALLQEFGVTTLVDPSRYGLSLVLGGGEVKLLELAGAYAVLAQEGVYHEQQLVLEVRDKHGRVLEAYEDRRRTVLNPELPRVMNDILSDVDARAGLFSGSLPLTVFPDYEVALKTGTSNDYRDAWAMGYTSSLVVGVWAGNNDNTPMHKKGSSILAAVPLWHDFLAEVLPRFPKEIFPRPEQELVENPVLAGEYIVEGQVRSLLHSVDRRNPLGPPPEDPTQDSQFANWDAAVASWVTAHAEELMAQIASTRGGNEEPLPIILSPTTGSVATTPQMTLRAVVVSPTPLTAFRVSLNGAALGEAPADQLATKEFSLPVTLPGGAAGAEYTIGVEAVNGAGFTGHATTTVRFL